MTRVEIENKLGPITPLLRSAVWNIFFTGVIIFDWIYFFLVTEPSYLSKYWLDFNFSDFLGLKFDLPNGILESMTYQPTTYLFLSFLEFDSLLIPQKESWILFIYLCY